MSDLKGETKNRYKVSFNKKVTDRQRIKDLEDMLSQKDRHIESLRTSLEKSRQMLERNITERYLAQVAQQETVEAYRSMFDVSPIAIIELDLSRIRRFISRLRHYGLTDLDDFLKDNIPAAKRLFSLALLKNVNLATLDLFKARDKEELSLRPDFIIPKQGWPIIGEVLVALDKGEQLYENETFSYSLTGVARYVAIRVSLASGREADWSHVFLSVIDITGRKVAEDRRLESEKKYKLLVDNAADGVAVLQDEHLVFLNPRALEIMEHKRADLVSQPFHLLIHPQDIETVRDFVSKVEAIKDDKISNLSFRLLTPQGEIKLLDVRAVSIEWKKRPAILCIFCPVKPYHHQEQERMLRKQLETAIETAERTCQEINQPLQSILMNVEILLEKELEDMNLKASLEIIYNQANRLRNITYSLNRLNASNLNDFLPYNAEPLSR